MDTRSVLDTGLDLARDEFSPEERDGLLAWYREHHDLGDLDLAAFARFQLHHDQAGFKRGRRYIFSIDDVPGAELPTPIAVLLFVHTYTAMGFAKGAMYEAVALRNLGATRAEVRAAIRLGSLYGGPRGLNALGELMTTYLDEWSEDGDDTRGLPWPADWREPSTVLRTPLDAASTSLSPDEQRSLREWYQRVYGQVPDHLGTLIDLGAGPSLKAALLRFDGALDGVLPAKVVPLMMVHRAVVQCDERATVRALGMADALGVERQLVLRVILWAAYYGGEETLLFACSRLDLAGHEVASGR